VTLKQDGSPRLLVGGKEYAIAQVVDYQLPPTQPTIHTPSPTP
jgi:hypothetical protein